MTKKDSKDLHRQSTHSLFLSYQQVTKLETQEQHHWVKHWNQTQHLLNSNWQVTMLHEDSQMTSICMMYCLFIIGQVRRVGWEWSGCSLLLSPFTKWKCTCCDMIHSVVKQRLCVFMCDVWCRMASRSNPIGVCVGFCTMSISSTSLTIPSARLVSHTWFLLMHEVCMVVCGIDTQLLKTISISLTFTQPTIKVSLFSSLFQPLINTLPRC